jgi:hypothetical protein
MKKIFYLLVASLVVGNSLLAAPGDTTWVQAQSINMDGGGNYDSTVTFPTPGAGVSYRNIYMIFTLGKHTCPGYTYGTGSVPWCGDWDYTVKNKIMTPGGDTLELGRLITPYANAGNVRTPYTWTQRYEYDVTDYASKLQGSATVRISFDAGSGGWTGNIRFAFVEGIPDRTVTSIEKIYSGSFGYGHAVDINTHFPAVSRTAPSGTASTDLKVTVTGHGGNGTTCCEFQPHSYQVMLNGTSFATKSAWRDNCGLNELYPQSGTWLYDRANWCPGAMVMSYQYTLPGVVGGSAYNTNIQFDPYTADSAGYYIVEGTIINYSSMNKATDAGITQIVSPSNNENHFRENPISGTPVVRVKNRGAAPITSVTIQYGIQDSAMSTYTWSGNLVPLQDTDITLPDLLTLHNIAGASGAFTFVAKITAVNGAADVDATDDIMTSPFVAGPIWQSPFRIFMKTNNEDFPVGSGTSETGWKIYDVNNNVVASRTGGTISTLYTDTVNLWTGAYKLVMDDAGCDGLYWWANPSSVTAGYLFVRKYATSANIPLNGYQYSGQYANDFGCNFTQYFYVDHPFPAGVNNNIVTEGVGINAYPNPAQDNVTVDLSGIDKVKGKLQVVDIMGRIVMSQNCATASTVLNVSKLTAGVYTLQFVNDAGNKLTARLLITK